MEHIITYPKNTCKDISTNFHSDITHGIFRHLKDSIYFCPIFKSMEKKEKQTKRTKVQEAGYKKPVSKYEGVETQLDPFLRALVMGKPDTKKK